MSERRLESISPTVMSSLSDTALLDLMDQVPLDELYKTDRDDARWQSLKLTALARRRSVTLMLMVGRVEMFVIKESRLNIPHLTELDLSTGHYPITPELDIRTVQDSIIRVTSLSQDEAARLARAFPQVRSLRVVIFATDLEENSMPQVTFLLTEWKATLVSLKLWYLGPQPSAGLGVSLLSALNSLVVLKHLTLDMPIRLVALSDDSQQQEERVTYPQIDLQVLAGLKELNLVTLDHPNCLVDSLARYAHECDIRLTMDNHFRNSFPCFEAISQAVVSRIRSITSSDGYCPILVDQSFGICCARFDGLTTLSIQIEQAFSMIELSGQLAPLGTNLIHLYMRFNYKDKVLEDGRFVDRPFGLLQECLGPLLQLASVRILSLSSQTITHRHTNLTPLRLGEVFPNLNVVQVVDSQLYGFDCEHQCHSLFKPEPAKFCIARQLQSLSLCTSLQAIFYGDINGKRYERRKLFPDPSALEGPNMVDTDITRDFPNEMAMERFARMTLSELFFDANANQVRDAELHRRTEVNLFVDLFDDLLEQVRTSRFNQNWDTIRHNSLSSLWLTQTDTLRLINTFSRLTALGLFHRCSEHYYEQMVLVQSILHHFKDSLTKLTIFFENSSDDYSDYEYPLLLLSTINGMRMLEHLSLEFPGEKILHYEDPELGEDNSFDLAILARLTSFRFWSHDHPRMMLPSLLHYAETNNALTHVHLLVDSGVDWFQGEEYQSLSRLLRDKIQFGLSYEA